jgi:hypothetical protein
MKDIIRQVLVLLSTLGVIAVNGLASASGLNNQTTGEISDQFDVFFVPAGYVFSIWGLIYLGLIAYTIYQLLPSQRENPRLQQAGYLYVLSAAANVGWLFLWHYEIFMFVPSLVVMAILLLLLIAIYLVLGIGRRKVSAVESWTVRVPFSIYLGWITVATIANATSLLDYLNWGGWGLTPEVWAIIMLAVAAVVALLVSLTRGDVAYALVIVWAFAGIAVKHSDTNHVAWAAWSAAGFVALTLLPGVLLQRRRMRRWAAQSAPIRDRW